MSRFKRSWPIQPLLAGALSLSALVCGCKDSTSKDSEQAPTRLAEDAAATAAPTRPLDPSFVPSDALAELQELELDAEAPCSLTIDSLRPVLASIAENQHKLATATDEDTAVQLLTEMSADLRSRLPSIPARTETGELGRISAELSASLGDLAESLQLAGDALRTHDKAAAAATLRRIHNGVSNTRSSVEGLIHQCAP